MDLNIRAQGSASEALADQKDSPPGWPSAWHGWCQLKGKAHLRKGARKDGQRMPCIHVLPDGQESQGKQQVQMNVGFQITEFSLFCKESPLENNSQHD